MNRSTSRSPRSARRCAAIALTALALVAAPALVSTTAQAAEATPAYGARTAAKCVEGTPEPEGRYEHDHADVSPAVKQKVQAEIARYSSTLRARAARSGAAPLPKKITVPVRIHIIRGKHKKDRFVTRAAARKLFYTLRGGFNGKQDPRMTPTGITFELHAITVTRNDSWFHAGPGSKADRVMHRTLHAGKRRVLNIYLNNPASEGGALLGIARFPWLAGPYPKLDGVTINVESLPGGKARGYNLGDTVIHEVGHWFGLFHTFEGGCESPGDFVNDTAPEAEPSFRCDLDRDSCPTERPEGWVEGDPEPEPVVDPVQNFMDYSYDKCMTHFTPDQRTRAVTLFMRYRAGR